MLILKRLRFILFIVIIKQFQQLFQIDFIIKLRFRMIEIRWWRLGLGLRWSQQFLTEFWIWASRMWEEWLFKLELKVGYWEFIEMIVIWMRNLLCLSLDWMTENLFAIAWAVTGGLLGEVGALRIELNLRGRLGLHILSKIL